MSETLSLLQLMERFPDEEAARTWFESVRWPDGVSDCPRCGVVGESYHVTSEKPMPYRCRACDRYFSVRTGTVMESSRLPLRKWVVAIYLFHRPKGISSLQLARDIGVTQKTAWFLLHRLREAHRKTGVVLGGVVEVDETYLGGKAINKSLSQRKGKYNADWIQDKIVVMGARSRSGKVVAKVVSDVTKRALQEFVLDHVEIDSVLYTDQAAGYQGLSSGYRHQFVNHGKKEYVRGDIHTNGIESFWSILKRTYHGTYHWMSRKHINRYLHEIAIRYNVRSLDVLDKMMYFVKRMEGRRLTYTQLVA